MKSKTIVFYVCLALYWIASAAYDYRYDFEFMVADMKYSFDWYFPEDSFLYLIAGLFVLACVFDASRYVTRKARWQRKFDRAKKMYDLARDSNFAMSPKIHHRPRRFPWLKRKNPLKKPC